MSTLVGIKYVGTKNRPVRDTVAGTSLVWVDNEQVHYVPEAIAAVLLKHTDSWGKVDTKEGDVSVADLGIENPAEQQAEQVEQPPLVNLESMDGTALLEYAQRQFNQRLPANMKPENMRARIRDWTNSPVLAG